MQTCACLRQDIGCAPGTAKVYSLRSAPTPLAPAAVADATLVALAPSDTRRRLDSCAILLFPSSRLADL